MLKKLFALPLVVLGWFGFVNAGCDNTPQICAEPGASSCESLFTFTVLSCDADVPLKDFAHALRNGPPERFEADMRCLLRAVASGQPTRFSVISTEDEGEKDLNFVAFGDGTASLQCSVGQDLDACKPFQAHSFQLADPASIGACEHDAHDADALKACIASMFTGPADGPVCAVPDSSC